MGPANSFSFRGTLISGSQTRALVIMQRAIELGASRKHYRAKISCTMWTDPGCENDPCHCRIRLDLRVLIPDSVSLCEGPKKQNGLESILYLCAIEPKLQPRKPWSPRNFYDNVHVPSLQHSPLPKLQIDELNCQLYPFQERAVKWLLEREGVTLQNTAASVVAHERLITRELPCGFFATTDAEDRNCYISCLLDIITTHEDLVWKADTWFKGGILAEEMGLGKTVEMIALICLHKESLRDGDQNTLLYPKSSQATLIITPPAILQQWKDEIHTLAPSLNVAVYEGLRQRSSHQECIDLIGLISKRDIVLTTYNVLASEIYYSGTLPERTLRYEKKFQRRKSPLLELNWWRVVLDEAQMIESGVSNAAKVAQLIPRQNAWAVSGTPLRKDAKDLLGLLIFLRYEPFSSAPYLWDRLVQDHMIVFGHIFTEISLRHTKEQIKDDIRLPLQKRFVVRVPFTAIEEQYYSSLYQEMAADCGLNVHGEPLADDWDPHATLTVEKMRSWLGRLRQTCSHPEVGSRNRRALGTGQGPLRSIGEVLEVLVDQNDTACRTEERLVLLSQIRRGQHLEHAKQTEKALEIWLHALNNCKNLVQASRDQMNLRTESSIRVNEATTSGVHRQRLRSALELEHTCTFFAANAYFQFKMSGDTLCPGNDQVRVFEAAEEAFYDRAKTIRKELLSEPYSKAQVCMTALQQKAETRSFAEIAEVSLSVAHTWLETRTVIPKLEELCGILNEQANHLDEWREALIRLLLRPLVDQEDVETDGEEYETSTKQQDEIYVYVEALRALVADRHYAITGQRNNLIEHEMKLALEQAIAGNGHSPELMTELLATRLRVRPDEKLGSIRGLLTEVRAMKNKLHGREVNPRTTTELAIIELTLQEVQRIMKEQLSSVSDLERELDIFMQTMNARLEYYRALQQLSDIVVAHEETFDAETLATVLEDMKVKEGRLQAHIATLQARGRYLVHLRHESNVTDASHLCIICQSPFKNGALTSCGHSYCNECLRIWWSAHRNCPTCKKHLSRNDFHQITYVSNLTAITCWPY